MARVLELQSMEIARRSSYAPNSTFSTYSCNSTGTIIYCC